MTLAEIVPGFMMGDWPMSRLKMRRDLSASFTALTKGDSPVLTPAWLLVLP